jgi:hypothetical protein
MSATAPAQTNGYITAKLNEPADLVRQYRSNAVALRRLYQSIPNRNVGATTRAIRQRTEDKYLAEVSAHSFGTRDQQILLAALVTEHDLLMRLAVAEHYLVDRPDLRARLLNARRIIRKAL